MLFWHLRHSLACFWPFLVVLAQKMLLNILKNCIPFALILSDYFQLV